MREIQAFAVIAFLSLPLVTTAADNDELDSIRQQIEALRQEYESRIKALEQRLEQAFRVPARWMKGIFRLCTGQQGAVRIEICQHAQGLQQFAAAAIKRLQLRGKIHQCCLLETGQ